MVDKPGTPFYSTGFIFQQDNAGIFILTTGHQIPPLFNNCTNVSKSRIGVRVDFFDRTTSIDGSVVHYDLLKDLTLVQISACEKVSEYPIPCINSIGFSSDQTYKGQSVYSIHHPIMFHVNTGQNIMAFNQYTEGFVADDNYYDIGQVHFSMPLLFPGSSGSPVLDKNSNKLVSMILGYDSFQGHDKNTPFGPNSNVQHRHRGVFVSTILQFLGEASAVDPPPQDEI